ncbi:MAG: asparagine synthase (glutamine-hydrolyzing) [Ferruginibacter sp.]
MCRIAGILNPSLSVESLQSTVASMCEILKHGGPDDGGIFISEQEHLVLGNRRLALMDLTSAGHQPMHYAQRFTITYNGELYNFRTLRKTLQEAGLVFKTNSDTEVILAAFAKWNTQSFSKLNGMFAFALWDNEEKKLYLVRDATGIKPLYYSTHNGGICFASEMRGFKPVDYLDENNNKVAVYQLAYGFIPEPITTLKHVKPLPKGCYFMYDCNTQLTTLQAFAFFSFNNTICNHKEAQEKIFTTTEDAVARQMLADEEVGIFLSGGTDSAILAKLANNHPLKKLHTISIYFEEAKYSEKKYQNLVADELKSTHHSILLREADFHAHFLDVIRAMDMPTCDGINTWFISRFASSIGLKAVLSGIGADELYGGYPSFARMQKTLLMHKAPDALLGLSANLDLKKYNRLAYLRMEGIRGVYLFLRGHFTPTQIAEQLGAYEKDVWTMLASAPTSPTLSNIGIRNKASWMEFNIYMQDQLLRDADVMSMAHGLEIRVPFLDNEVIKTAFSITENIKFGGKLPKQLLTDTFKKLLPEAIWQRPKMGFSFPFNEWLKNSPLVHDLAGSKNTAAQKAVKDFMNGELHWSRVMSLLVLRS